MKLTIERYQVIGGLQIMRIGGFREGELRELKMMKHEDATDRLLDMLDERNMKIGTAWHNGYGVYRVWFDDEYAYVSIGLSCD